MMFQKATKKAAKARVALIGPSGSGKTFTALRMARGLAGAGRRIALADSERGSASKYADRFEFDAHDMEQFSPRDYISVIQEADKAGYDVLIIDSLSHAWMGKGGALEMVDAAAKASKSRNSFDAWRAVTPEHNAMVDAILRARCHVIVTLRVKTEYVVEEVNGKKTPRKVGLAPVQRDGLEYEFDVVADMDGAELVVTKTRCPSLAKAVVAEPGEKLGETLRAWLTDGAPALVAGPSPKQEAPAADEPEQKPLTPPAEPGGAIRLGPVLVAFGPHKGKQLNELTDEHLAAAIDLGHEKLMEQPRAKWAKAMRENVAALEAEQARRVAEDAERAKALAAPPREKKERAPLTLEAAEKKWREGRTTILVGFGAFGGKTLAGLADDEVTMAAEEIEDLLKRPAPMMASTSAKDMLMLLGLELDSRMRKAGVAPIA